MARNKIQSGAASQYERLLARGEVTAVEARKVRSSNIYDSGGQ